MQHLYEKCYSKACLAIALIILLVIWQYAASRMVNYRNTLPNPIAVWHELTELLATYQPKQHVEINFSETHKVAPVPLGNTNIEVSL